MRKRFNLLRGIQKNGFEGDAGFYFWLAHSAYFHRSRRNCQKILCSLIDIDPSKEGFEPWKDMTEDFEPDSVEQDQEILTWKNSK